MTEPSGTDEPRPTNPTVHGQASVEQAPVEQIPVEQIPVERAPVEQTADAWISTDPPTPWQAPPPGPPGPLGPPGSFGPLGPPGPPAGPDAWPAAAPPGAGNWPPGPVPVPARRRNTKLLVGGVISGLVILALVVGLVGVPLYQWIFAASPTERVLAAATRLAAAPEARYTGGVAPSADDFTVERVDLRIGSGGQAIGSLTRPGGRADLLAGEDGTYLRGDKGWMLATQASSAGFRTGHWITADTDTDAGFSLSALTPAKLAHFLRSGLRAGSAGRAHQAVEARDHRATTLHGTPVVPYVLPSHAVVYLTAAEPYTVLAVDGKLDATDDGYLALTVTAGRAADRTALRRDVAARGKGLDADRDPVEPAHYTTVYSSEKQGTCDQDSCAESLRIRADGGDTSRRAHVVGIFSTDKGGQHVIGTCTATAPKIKPNKSVRVWCTTRSRQWRRWASVGGGKYWFFMLAVSPGWQADPQTVLHLFLNPGFAETAAGETDLSVVLSPAESTNLLDHLAGSKGWSASDALSAVTAVYDASALGPIHTLVDGGHLTLDPDTFTATFTPAQVPYYHEAARRVAAGSQRVAVGTWHDHSGSSYTADVFDLSRHRAIWMAAADNSTISVVDKSVRSVLAEARRSAVPDGFRREVRIVVGPRSGLYHLGRAAVRQELRAAGVTRSAMKGIGDLVLVTGTGTHTFHPADLG